MSTAVYTDGKVFWCGKQGNATHVYHVIKEEASNYVIKMLTAFPPRHDLMGNPSVRP